MITVVSKVTLLIPGKPLQALWSKLFNLHRNKSDCVKKREEVCGLVLSQGEVVTHLTLQFKYLTPDRVVKD